MKLGFKELNVLYHKGELKGELLMKLKKEAREEETLDNCRNYVTIDGKKIDLLRLKASVSMDKQYLLQYLFPFIK